MKKKLIALTLAFILMLTLAPVMPAFATGGVGLNQTISTSAHYHTLFIKSDNSLWATGANAQGQLGDGANKSLNSPVKVMDGVASVSTGKDYSMAVKTDGTLWAWGNNNGGQLGDGTKENKNKPVKIMDGVAAVSASGSLSFRFTLALKTDGTVWGWGWNNNGEIGDGTNKQKVSPVKVMDDAVYISAGHTTSFAIKTDGSLWAWGSNSYGMLGNGTAVTRELSPVKIMDNAASVSAGMNHHFAIKTDGTLWAWGQNDKGQLGNGTTTGFNDRNATPVKIMDGVVSASAGLNNSYAIKADGTLWGWGENNKDGHLGDGSKEHQPKPVKIMDGVASVSAGSAKIAVKTDGSLWAWGGNTYGPHGDGTNKPKSTPTKIMDGIKLPLMATPAETKVIVNGKEVTFPTYTINDTAYFNLRDIASALNGTNKQFNIDAANSIVLKTDTAYVKTGGEMPAKGAAVIAVTSLAGKIYLNSAEASNEIKLTAYIVADRGSFVKFEDIANALNFSLTRNSDNIRVVDTK
jgi:alpha-tubulin suppressor-like RCC1 family protein